MWLNAIFGIGIKKTCQNMRHVQSHNSRILTRYAISVYRLLWFFCISS